MWANPSGKKVIAKNATNKGGAADILFAADHTDHHSHLRQSTWGGLALMSLFSKRKPASMHRTCEDHLDANTG
jgi:hypothetical protein